MRIQDIMTAGVALTSPDMPVKDAAKKMRSEGVGALPVGENDRLVGMVTDRDIAVRAVASDEPTDTLSVRDVMTESTTYLFEDEGVDRAAEMMTSQQIQRLAVINRDKRLVGMVALADLARSGGDGLDAAAYALTGIKQPGGAARD